MSLHGIGIGEGTEPPDACTAALNPFLTGAPADPVAKAIAYLGSVADAIEAGGVLATGVAPRRPLPPRLAVPGYGHGGRTDEAYRSLFNLFGPINPGYLATLKSECPGLPSAVDEVIGRLGGSDPSSYYYLFLRIVEDPELRSSGQTADKILALFLAFLKNYIRFSPGLRHSLFIFGFSLLENGSI